MRNSKLIKPNDLEHLEVLFQIIKLDRAEQRQDNSDYVTGPVFQYMLGELRKYLPTATGLRVYYIAGKNEYSYQYAVTDCAATALNTMAKKNLPYPISCVTCEEFDQTEGYDQWEGGEI
jgi:hypothetical protein